MTKQISLLVKKDCFQYTTASGSIREYQVLEIHSSKNYILLKTYRYGGFEFETKLSNFPREVQMINDDNFQSLAQPQEETKKEINVVEATMKAKRGKKKIQIDTGDLMSIFDLEYKTYSKSKINQVANKYKMSANTIYQYAMKELKSSGFQGRLKSTGIA